MISSSFMNSTPPSTNCLVISSKTSFEAPTLGLIIAPKSGLSWLLTKSLNPLIPNFGPRKCFFDFSGI